MGVYSPEEYFKKLYPGWFSETGLAEAIFYVLIFTLLMLAFYAYIRYFEKRKYGEDIDCGKFIKDYTYNIRIIKLNGEWMAVKINMHTMEMTKLRRGDLNKVIDYVNRNFDLNCKYSDEKF